MSVIDVGKRVARNAYRIPVVGTAIQRDYERKFFGGKGHYRGTYPSFAAARAAIPETQTVGFDHAGTAALYRNRMTKACASDYGPLFWLQRVLAANSFVFDFGGHVGVSYHGWRNYLTYGEKLRWLVYDLPAITKVGEELATELPSRGLAFTNTVADGKGCDVFLTAGAIQFTERTLASVLTEVGRPRHVVISKVPVHDADPVVTVQSAGKSFHPYQIYNRARFISEIQALGYKLVDDWENAEQTCIIPFTPIEIEAYAGYYFTL